MDINFDINEAISKFTPLLEKLGEKVGQGGAFAWEVIVRQQYVIAAQAGIVALLGLVGMIAAIVFLRKGIKMKESSDRRWSSDGEGWLFAGGMIGTFSLIGFVIGSIIGVSHLINPEYYALEFLLNLVRY